MTRSAILPPFGALSAIAETPVAQLAHAIANFAKARVLIVGDIMLDAYLFGDSERISPEAPVPVVLVEEEKHLVGGAGNVARNITALGGYAHLIGVCGSDAPGERLMQCLEKDSIAYSLVQTPERPTTMKTRILARQQQMLRFDREDTREFSTNHKEALLRKVEAQLPECDVLVISDYGKGVISREVIDALSALVQNTSTPVPILVDPKPQNTHLYTGMTLLTPNARETSEAAGLPARSSAELLAAGRAIMTRLDLPYLLTTLGSRGMAVFQRNGEAWHIPTTARKVFDVTGAGDTVIATVALGLGTGCTVLESCLLANYAAGIVVGEVGAATATPTMLAKVITTLPKPTIVPLLSTSE